MKLRVLFFCGDRSRYGSAHLLPILQSGVFDVIGAVVPTEERWRHFREVVSGEPFQETSGLNKIKGLILAVLQPFVTLFRKSPDNVNKRKRDVARALQSRNVPLIRTFDVNESAFLEKIRAMRPDLVLSAGYPQIFSKTLLGIPRKGCVNFHPSLLPKYRGAHPHFWAIAKGEKTGGITAHFMTERIDDGDIIDQIEFPIVGYNYHQLYGKIAEETPHLVKKVEDYFVNDWPKATRQNEMESSVFREPREIHKRIFWGIQTAEEINNLIRTNHAFCFFKNKKVNPLSSFVSSGNRNLTNNVLVENGTIVDISKSFISVKAKDGCVNILEFERGGRITPPKKWALNCEAKVGEKFD